MISALKQIFRTTIDIVFPSKCVICKVLTTKELLICSECWQQLEFIAEPMCEVCGFPFSFDAGQSKVCINCMQDKPWFDQAVSLFKYTEHGKNLVHKFKYKDQLYMANFFAKLVMSRVGNALLKYQYIIPVPMHRKRLAIRRFNQSALLALHISKLSGLKFIPTALIKTRHTTPQSELSGKTRKANVKGSFALSNGIEQLLVGKNVVLIDDVYTTGSTLNECSKILKKAGCGKVLVITLAKVTLSFEC